MASKSTKKELHLPYRCLLHLLPGIGTLAVTETAARLGRNPHTGQPVPIPPRKTIKLKVSKDLKEAMEPSETVRTGGADFDAQ